jgi:hypothetical protein
VTTCYTPAQRALQRRLLAGYRGADLAVRVAISALFVNCSRYVHKYQRVGASRYVPRAEGSTPYAEWKRIGLVQDALPPHDAGKTAQAGGPITMDEYAASWPRVKRSVAQRGGDRRPTLRPLVGSSQ